MKYKSLIVKSIFQIIIVHSIQNSNLIVQSREYIERKSISLSRRKSLYENVPIYQVTSTIVMKFT